jgi:hypothetical protein
MARTKKFLANTTGAKTTRSFYRPLKRLTISAQPQVLNPVNFSQHRSINRQARANITPSYTTIKADRDTTSESLQNLDTVVKPETHHDKPRANESANTYISLDNPITAPLTKSQKQVSEDGLPKTSNSNTQLPKEHTDNDTDQNFGTHDISQEISKLEQSVEKGIEKDHKIAAQLRQMQEQFEHEKEKMEKTIHVLKKEIEHQEPLRDNKFFTISKELKDITEAMNRLLEYDTLESTSPSVLQPTVITSTGQTIGQISSQANLSQQVKIISGTPQTAVPSTAPSQTTEQKSQVPPTLPDQTTPTTTAIPPTVSNGPIKADVVAEPEKQTKRVRAIPKPLAILMTTVLLMGVIGGVIWYTFNKKPQVSTQLIQEYLPSDAKLPSPSDTPKEEKK